MRILIVEDDLISRILLRKILIPYGQCDVAADGEEAVEAFKLAWEEKNPYTLICMDIMMPKMDGKQALRMIRNLEHTMGIDEEQKSKILMTTALAQQEDVLDAIRSGATWYLVKPISKQKIEAELIRLELIQET